jgi:hypothetical protein
MQLSSENIFTLFLWKNDEIKKCVSVISFLNKYVCAAEFIILKEKTRIECDEMRTWIKAALSVTKMENFAGGEICQFVFLIKCIP